MADTRLLFDAFEIYYDRGISALKDSDYGVARRNILASAETLLKIAKDSDGVVKAQRLKRANELYSLANKIEEKQRRELGISNIDSVATDAKKFGISPTSTSKGKSDKNAKPQGEDDLTEFLPAKNTGISLDDVAGLKSAKDEIRRLIIEPRKHPEIYEKFKKKKGGGILLYGVPGTGKTMFAQAIATELDAAFFSVKCSDIASKWFGDSEQNVKRLFDEARKHPCSIIFFDEFEALGAKRDSNSTVMKRLVPELLAQMQGFEKSENTLMVIAATNRPWDIDSAFLRPGRFNTSIYVPLPDEEARRTIISKQLDGIPLVDNFDIGKVVALTDKFNGSDVTEFCDKLKDYALQRTIETGVESKVTNEDVLLTAERVHSSVQLEDIKKIAKYQAGL